jgi:hypothetical protein
MKILGITSIRAEIRPEHYPNKNLDRYRCANPLNDSANNSDYMASRGCA